MRRRNSCSGYTKLLSPNWVSGDAVALVMQNPLARDWFLRDGAYDALARFRRHLAARAPGLSPVVSRELAGRFRTGPETPDRRHSPNGAGDDS